MTQMTVMRINQGALLSSFTRVAMHAGLADELSKLAEEVKKEEKKSLPNWLKRGAEVGGFITGAALGNVVMDKVIMPKLFKTQNSTLKSLAAGTAAGLGAYAAHSIMPKLQDKAKEALSGDKGHEKTAISNELKRKAFIEREGRIEAAHNVASDFGDLTRQLKDKDYHKAVTSQFKSKFGVNKPTANPYNPHGVFSNEDNKAILERGRQIVTNTSTKPTFGNSLSDHVKGVKAKKLTRNVALGAGGLALAGGAAYAGKKLYDHYKKPE